MTFLPWLNQVGGNEEENKNSIPKWLHTTWSSSSLRAFPTPSPVPPWTRVRITHKPARHSHHYILSSVSRGRVVSDAWQPWRALCYGRRKHSRVILTLCSVTPLCLLPLCLPNWLMSSTWSTWERDTNDGDRTREQDILIPLCYWNMRRGGRVGGPPRWKSGFVN